MNALNLLPWRFRRRLLLRVRISQWAVVALSGVALVMVAAGIEYARIIRKEQTLSRLEMRSAALREMVTESSQVAARMEEAKKLQSLLSRVENQELPLSVMGLVSRAVRESEGKLQMQGVVLHRNTVAIPVKDAAGKELPGKTENEETIAVVLNGVAVDNLAVADMVLRLRESGVFDQVSLKHAASAPSRAALAAGGPAFQVECTQRTRR